MTGSFDAGSISGGINLDISQYMSGMDQAGSKAESFGSRVHSGIDQGMLGAEATLKLFPAIVIEFVENPILGAIALFGELANKAKEAAAAIGEAFSDIASHALETGLAAEKAGVSVEFFSRMSEAAKTVNISSEQLSTGFKFMERNAVDAANGNAEAQKSFLDLGISMDFVRTHLGNTEAMWNRIHNAVEALPSSAEKARRSMEVLGKSGSDLVPLFEMSSAKIKELGDQAQRFGAVDDGKSAELGRQWKEMTTQMDQAWEGMKKRMLEPFMEAIAAHWKEFLPVLEKVADVIGKLIPKALELLKNAFIDIMPLIDMFLAGLQGIAEVTDAFGVTQGAADTVKQGREALQEFKLDLSNINFNINADKAAKQIGKELAPHVDNAVRQFHSQVKGYRAKQTVARGLGGRHE